ncbi:hypothetical protein T4E_7621 [Trichinella pseudospiralis]|uniref:Uncharacterized protein n=1 Tax=Trichinella pseudospiralis TaxID=6337 RepID=A0A0V0XV10_TRIPS|nr:hypothetical protein T4E_7621 [Trichinella pseudospiralis]
MTILFILVKQVEKAYDMQIFEMINFETFADLHENDEAEVEKKNPETGRSRGRGRRTKYYRTEQEEKAASGGTATDDTAGADCVDEPVRCAARRRPTLIGHLATETGPFARHGKSRPRLVWLAGLGLKPDDMLEFRSPTYRIQLVPPILCDRPLDKTTESIDHPGPREPHTWPVKRHDCNADFLHNLKTRKKIQNSKITQLKWKAKLSAKNLKNCPITQRGPS